MSYGREFKNVPTTTTDGTISRRETQPETQRSDGAIPGYQELAKRLDEMDRVAQLKMETARLRAYRKNARKSMRQMQLALERKNREIAELKNKAVHWCAESEKARMELFEMRQGNRSLYGSNFWMLLTSILRGRR